MNEPFFLIEVFNFLPSSFHDPLFYFILFLKIFLMWTIFKVFIEFVTVLLLFYVLVFWPQGMWDLSSPTRDWTLTHCIGRWSLNYWTTREFPWSSILKKGLSYLINNGSISPFKRRIYPHLTSLFSFLSAQCSLAEEFSSWLPKCSIVIICSQSCLTSP